MVTWAVLGVCFFFTVVDVLLPQIAIYHAFYYNMKFRIAEYILVVLERAVSSDVLY